MHMKYPIIEDEIGAKGSGREKRVFLMQVNKVQKIHVS